MQSKDVINTASGTAALGVLLSVASGCADGALSNTLNTLSLVVCSMTLGALLTHFPGFPSR